MAPLDPQPTSSSPRKQSSPTPDVKPDPDSKRPKRHYHHHHRLQSPVYTGLQEPAITDDPSVDSLLNMSIARILNEVGFTHSDPVALDSMRNGIEECKPGHRLLFILMKRTTLTFFFFFLGSDMLSFLAYIRESMTTCRRVQPIPTDFEHALQSQRVSLSSLQHHLKPLRTQTSPAHLLPTPPSEETQPRTELPFLGPALAENKHGDRNIHIPKHFPAFPSKHTYQQTPIYTTRETDPRRVREHATEEGRLGEEALRKLARAGKDTLPGSTEQKERKLWARKSENMESMFDKAVKSLTKKAPEHKIRSEENSNRNTGVFDFGISSSNQKAAGSAGPTTGNSSKIELGPIVNCDRPYWRKSSGIGMRKPDKKPADTKENAILKIGL